MDKEGGWTEVKSSRRQARASAAYQGCRGGRGGRGGGGRGDNTSDQQQSEIKGPPKNREEAFAQNDPFYIRGFMGDLRITNGVRRSKLCPFCGGVKEPVDGQQKCSGLLRCKYLKALGFEIKKVSSASPANPGNTAEDQEEDEQADATPAASGVSVTSEETREDWVVDDDPLGVEASANHVTAESPPGARGSTNSNTSAIDYPAVSPSRSPQT